MSWVNGRGGCSCRRVDCGMQGKLFDIVCCRHFDGSLQVPELEDISFRDYHEASVRLQHKSMASQLSVLRLVPHFYIARLLLARQVVFVDLFLSVYVIRCD